MLSKLLNFSSRSGYALSAENSCLTTAIVSPHLEGVSKVGFLGRFDGFRDEDPPEELREWEGKDMAVRAVGE